MSDLVEKVGLALLGARASNGWATIGQRDAYARAAIAAVLDNLMDPTDAMMKAPRRNVYGVDFGEQEAEFLRVLRAMLTAKRKELDL